MNDSWLVGSKRSNFSYSHCHLQTPRQKQSTMKQFFQRILPPERRASPASQYPNGPDARNTTTTTDVPSTSVSRPLPVSPQNDIVNQPSTVSGPTGIGEQIGRVSCTDRHQPGSQIITLRFSLTTRHQAILHHMEEACTRFWRRIQ